MFGAVDDEASQTSGSERTGVDADAILSDVGLGGDVVPMDDDFPKIVVGSQKLVPNPEHVAVGLFAEGDTRPHPRVHKEIIAHLVTHGQRPQKSEVTGRQRFR